ncbi:MAG: hypothetical protein MUW56_12705 [Chryseobacterium sp.]|uniref:hypothetical protein n=1 Tax=Chryseobacterium sp. TaxID=1871047 RepID=UPI0025C224DE|nr:hypothetical protein [Chryseobacterium sp.]MCJ7934464.1 hypothetical protein [Chryseobacterium sp.]
MSNISRKYIDDHKKSVHTADSFGRALIEQILSESIQKIGTEEAQSVNVDVKFKIEAFEPATCLRVCANINGVEVCYHVNM